MTKTLKTKQRCRRKPIPEWCTPSQWIYITINTQYTNWTGSVQTHSPGDRQPDQNRKENQSQRSRHREVKDTATPYGPNISFQSKSKWSGSNDQNQKEGVMGTIPKLPTYSVIQWNPNTKSIIKGATHNLSGKLVNIGILSSSGPFPKYGSKFCPWNKIKFNWMYSLGGMTKHRVLQRQHNYQLPPPLDLTESIFLFLGFPYPLLSNSTPFLQC